MKKTDKKKWEERFAALVTGIGAPPMKTQYRFHPERLWRFDFAWPQRKIAFEIEGGIWRKGGGAHSHPLNIERDIEKLNAAALLGWRVIRITGKMLPVRNLFYDEAARLVREAWVDSGAAEAVESESVAKTI
ncbi:MAG: hypothetical protein UMS36scaffold28_36 [Phage 59_13]|nr:MAG: hypothetical protein UMS36scaffold28_36 [Phage 59_13]